MNLVLIGYRGTGKTTLSEALRERLGMPVHHLDEILEQRFGVRIAEFVARHGWDEFRREEEILIQELSALDRVILDTGGGAVVRPQNVERLRANGWVVWLQSSPETIARYIQHDANRPSLTGHKSAVEEIVDVLSQRTPLYAAAAHFSLWTDRIPLDECVNRILEEWKKRHETLETL